MKTKLFTSLLAIMANIGVLLAAYQDDATVIFSESFSSSQGQFTIENKQLPSALSYVWKWRSAEYGMVASAYTSGTSYATESWLISPSISLSNCTSATLSFDHAVNKGEPTNFKVKISTDNGSSWSDLSISQWPAGSNWTFINATASLDAYSGQNIKIAFCYNTTTSLCPQWEIKNFCVKANSTNSPSFVGFEANNRLGEQIYSEGLIRDRVNVTLEETDTDVHKYNINLINGGEGTFTMGGITFSFTHTEAGKIAYKTYNTYIQPNGVDREIRIPTVAGAQINVVLIDACAGMLVNGVSMDFAAGDNIITASGSSVILRNPTNKPKISAILPFGGETTDPDPTPDPDPDSTQVGGKVKIGDLYYNLDATNQTAEVTSQNNSNPFWSTSISVVNIPSSVTYNNKSYSVTRIGEHAFDGCRGLTSITIPNSVTSIGRSAFRNCTGLTSINIPNNVTSIGDEAFYYCTRLTSITLPSSITSIGNWAFENCSSLTSIIAPCGELDRFEQMYSDSRLQYPTSPYIVSAVQTLNGYVNIPSYSGCDDSIQVSATPNEYYHFVLWTDGNTDNPRTIYLTQDINIEAIFAYNPIITYVCDPKRGYMSGATTIPSIEASSITFEAIPYRGYKFVRWADGNTDNPRTIELTQDTTMEAIFDYLLTGKCGKDSVLTWTLDTTTMALSITGNGALSDCYTYAYNIIESLTIGNEVTIIGVDAFESFNKLKNVILGSSVKMLDNRAFVYCSALETITCYSQRPPTVNFDALYGVDYATIVYVPADYLNTYQMHDAWGLYDVRPLGAKTTETTDVNVTPSETTAEVAWPSVTGAASYELVIRDKDGNVICTLVFNANGQLTSIAFNAPSRDHAPMQTQTAGFEFTVTGLEEGESYDLTITSKDSNGAVLDQKTVSFTTGEEQGIDHITNVDHITNDQSPINKVMMDGQILILRGDKTYTLTGQEVE